MSRFIVVAPGSSEAAVLATDELARVLGVATVDALAGTTAPSALRAPPSQPPSRARTVLSSIFTPLPYRTSTRDHTTIRTHSTAPAPASSMQRNAKE